VISVSSSECCTAVLWAALLQPFCSWRSDARSFRDASHKLRCKASTIALALFVRLLPMNQRVYYQMRNKSMCTQGVPLSKSGAHNALHDTQFRGSTASRRHLRRALATTTFSASLRPHHSWTPCYAAAPCRSATSCSSEVAPVRSLFCRPKQNNSGRLRLTDRPKERA
jgi:hypothetical protein